MKERLNGLQRQINEVKGVTDCIIGTVAIAGDADSGFLTWGDSAKGDQIFPVIDPACV